MQSVGEESHHSDHGSDSPGDAHSRSRFRLAAQAAGERRFQALPASARPPDCSQVFPRTLATVLCSPTAKSSTTATVTATRPATARFPDLLDGCSNVQVFDETVRLARSLGPLPLILLVERGEYRLERGQVMYPNHKGAGWVGWLFSYFILSHRSFEFSAKHQNQWSWDNLYCTFISSDQTTAYSHIDGALPPVTTSFRTFASLVE